LIGILEFWMVGQPLAIRILPENPDRKMRSFMIGLALIGLLDALYLTWVKLTGATLCCVGAAGCESVSASPYALLGRIPIALFGAVAYLVILLFLLLDTRSLFWWHYGTMLVFGLSLAGALYSAYLTYIEVTVLRAMCPYCFFSTFVMIAIFAFAFIRVVRGHPEDA
jgi:uncharacterized membrane protein